MSHFKETLMKKKFLDLILASILFVAPQIAQAGGEHSGGGQGAMDVNGSFYFLDILSKSELSNLKPTPASQSDIISDIDCSSEQFRELEEYEFNRNPDYETVYPIEGKFETELSEARKLLSAAGKALQTNLTCPSIEFYVEGLNKMPNLGNMLPQNEFRATAFRLPQNYDASQIPGEYQIQIAYFNYGVTYFQQQAMIRLKEKARGVFIKETLRTVNLKYDLRLRNIDLEKATYFIYKGEVENFKSSAFAQSMKNKFPDKCRDLTFDEIMGTDGLNRAIAKSVLPDFMSYLERTEAEKSYVYRAPEGKVWSTKTGRLLDLSVCKSQNQKN
jgi:hypothetical protein